MTISKFKIGFIFWFVIMLLLTLIIISFIYRLCLRIDINGLWTTLWIGMLLTLIAMVSLIVLKDFKLIKIDKDNRRLKWFSIFFPFGRSIHLDDYIGTIKSSETGSLGQYSTLYLVNRNRTTSFKINGLFYSNFDEMETQIGLNEIKSYKLTFKLYIRLLFAGKIKI